MTDVITVYKYVIKKMQEDRDSVDELLKLRKKLSERKEKERKGIERKLIDSRIVEINRKIRKFSSSHIQDYKEEMRNVILEYRKLGPEVYDFDTGLENNKKERIDLLNRTLAISRKYVSINFVAEDINNNSGSVICQCGANVRSFVKQPNGTLQCNECYITIHGPVTKSSKIVSVVDSTIKGMEKSIQYFQGKGRNIITSEIIEKIKNCANLHYKGLLDNIEWGVHKVGQDHTALYRILSISGLSKYDDHINLIGNILFGWKLPELSDVEVEFMEIFIEIRKAYLSLDKVRKSSLNKGYMKCQTLKLVGRNFPVSWFKIVDGQDRLEQYERLWKESCEKCKNPKIRYIPLYEQ